MRLLGGSGVIPIVDAAARWLWLVAPLGIARAVMLVTRDEILRRPRARGVARSRARAAARLARLSPAELDETWRVPYAYRAKLWTCPLCAGVWLSGAAVAGLVWAPRATVAVLLVGAFALVGSTIAAAVAGSSPAELDAGEMRPGPAEAPSGAVADALADLGV